MSAEEREQKAIEEHEMRMRRSIASKKKANQKKEKVRKTPWRNSSSKPDNFPNPYDNGPRWSETLRKMDDVAPPSASDLERRAAEVRRATSAERRARNRADQAEWDAPPAAAGGPPESNPYEDPVAWVGTLRGAEDGSGPAGVSTRALSPPRGEKRHLQPASHYRKSVEAESKIAAQVRADKEIYKARVKQQQQERRSRIVATGRAGFGDGPDTERDDNWNHGGFSDQPVPAAFYDPAGMEQAAAAAGPVGHIEPMWPEAETGVGGGAESDVPPWKLVQKYLPEGTGGDNLYP